MSVLLCWGVFLLQENNIGMNMNITRQFILFIGIVIMGITGYAQTTLTGSNKEVVISAINKATASMSSMECSFSQTKYLKLLSDKMVSSGKMYYRKNDKLRWEYISPYNYLFIFNGHKVYVGNKSKKDVIDTNKNKIFKEIARIIMNTVTGKALSSETDFTSEVQSIKSGYKVILIPRKKDMRQMFSKIELSFARNTYIMDQLNIYEKNGDRTNIQLKDIKLNGKINETLFAIP